MKAYTQDEYLVKALMDYKASVLDDLSAVQDSDDEDDQEIAADYKEILSLLEPLLPQIHDLDTLAEMDDEDVGFVYECLVTWESVFIISFRTKEEEEQTQAEHKILESIIDLFED